MAAALAGCAAPDQWQQVEGGGAGVAEDGTEVRPALVRSRTEEALAAASGVDDMARFLAGLPGGRGSVLNPLREQLYDPRPDGKGEIAVPDGAGLGIAIDIERLADYVTDHWVLEA